jgi:hypothetical protein
MVTINTYFRAVLLMLIGFFGACSSNNETESAQIKEELITTNTNDADTVIIIDGNQYAEFKRSAEIKLSENESKIVVLKADLSKDKKDIKKNINKKIAEIEDHNKRLRAQIADFKEEEIGKLDAFKAEFNKDLDSLDQEIENLFKTN